MNPCIKNFAFVRCGLSHLVLYQSPFTGKQIIARIRNKSFINATKNAEHPTREDLMTLYNLVMAAGRIC